MPADKDVLLNEIRYAERLCQRTARLYRRLQSIGTFGTVLGGSAALTALSSSLPSWVSVSGAAVFTVFGAAMLAIRPADKAAANETDMRRYATLRTEALAMDALALEVALNKARQGDAPEIEALREVAYNDLMREIGQDGYAGKLSLQQRVIASLA